MLPLREGEVRAKFFGSSARRLQTAPSQGTPEGRVTRSQVCPDMSRFWMYQKGKKCPVSGAEEKHRVKIWLLKISRF